MTNFAPGPTAPAPDGQAEPHLRPKRRIWPFVAAIAVLAAVLVVVLIWPHLGSDKPAAAPAATQTTTTAATTAAPVDPSSQAACVAAWRASSSDRLMTTDILAVEAPARDSTDPGIKAAGAKLLDAYRQAVLSKSFKDGDEAITQANLLAASAEMDTACIKAGISVH